MYRVGPSSWIRFNQRRSSTNILKTVGVFDVCNDRHLGTQLYSSVMYSMNSFRVPITHHRRTAVSTFAQLWSTSCVRSNTN